jgi:hypothetical protein
MCLDHVDFRDSLLERLEVAEVCRGFQRQALLRLLGLEYLEQPPVFPVFLRGVLLL